MFQKMSKTVETEMVFVKEECGTVDVKEEPAEEQDPLNVEKGNRQLEFMPFQNTLGGGGEWGGEVGGREA